MPLFFTISNEEGRSLEYRYVLRETDPLGTSQTLSEAEHVVQSGATWIVDTKVRPSCVLSPCRVEVLLPGHPETIDFLVVLRAAKPTHKHKSSHQGAHTHHAARK